MKKYNIQNYIRYKEDVKQAVARLEGKMWDEYTREELMIKFFFTYSFDCNIYIVFISNIVVYIIMFH